MAIKFLNDGYFAGSVGIGTTSPVGKLNINTGLTGISYDMVNQANGSISFSNNSGGTAAPTITGKSNNNLGLMFVSGTNNTGPVADMYFDVRENDNTDYATLTSSAYRFNRAGNALMTILRSGNVGIGTTSPGAKLDVIGTGVFGQGTSFSRNSSSGLMILENASTETSMKFWQAGVASALIGHASGSTNFYLTNAYYGDGIGTANKSITLTRDGNVGIGTSSPAKELHISKDGQSGVRLTSTVFGADFGLLGSVGGQNGFGIYDYNAAGYRFNIDSSGNVGIGTTSPGAALHVQSAATKLFLSNTDFNTSTSTGSGLILHTGASSGNTYGQIYAFQSGNTAYANLVVPGGNVGIGTTSPYAYDTTATKLHIKNAGSSGSISEVARLEGSSDADGSGAILRISTSNDRGMYLEGGRTGAVPYAGIGTTEYNGAKTEGIRITSTGNVGIGTTSPDVPLEVVGSNTLRIHDGTDQGSIFFRGDRDDVYIKESSYQLLFGAPSGMVFELDTNANDSDFFNVTHRNSSRFLIDGASGNVGIGTSSPSAKLAVVGTTKVGEGVGSNSAKLMVNTVAGQAASIQLLQDGVESWIIQNPASTTALTFGNSGTERMRIDSSGNVGIGTTSPNEKLDVQGKVYIESQGVDWNETTPGLTRGALHFDPVGSGADNTGNAITFGASDSSVGTNANAGIYTRSDGTYGTKMYFATTDSYALGSKTRMMLDYNGNVGIGTSSPGSKLSVNGNADISGALTLGTALAVAEGGTGLTSISTLLNSNVTSVSGSSGSCTGNAATATNATNADLLDGQHGSYYYPASNPNGYTNDQTAAEILHAIKTVDGAGSGLDADLLDGQHGSYYQPAGSYLTAETNAFIGDGGDGSTHPGTSRGVYSGQLSQGTAALGMPTTDNSNSILTFNRHGGDYNSQLGFSSNGSMYYRSFSAVAINNSTTWRKQWDSGNDGSGSGLDADLLDGLQSSFAPTGNTVPVRDANGDISAREIVLSSGLSAQTPTVLVSMYPTTNQLVRTTPAAVAASMGAWTSSNDGSGSGLDADLLDGVQGSQFLRSDATDSFSGNITFSSYLISNARDKGLFGTYDSTKTDQIWSMGTSYRNNASGTDFGNLYGIAYKHTNNSTGGTLGGGHQMVWCSNGTPKAALGDGIWTSGDVTAYSDIAVKRNLVKIPNALEKVCSINGYTYERTDYVKDPKDKNAPDILRQAGVVAQEIEKVLPEVVSGEDGNKAVAYGNIVALLIEAIKEQQQQINELKQQLKQ